MLASLKDDSIVSPCLASRSDSVLDGIAFGFAPLIPMATMICLMTPVCVKSN